MRRMHKEEIAVHCTMNMIADGLINAFPAADRIHEVLF